MEIHIYESNGAGDSVVRVYFGKTSRLMSNWKNIYSAMLETKERVLILEEKLINAVGRKRFDYRDFTANFSDLGKSDLGLGFSDVAAKELSEFVRKTFNL